MQSRKIPTWGFLLFGIAAVVAGVLGVTHAPPAIGKATWAVVIVLGVISLGLAAFRRRSAEGTPGGRDTGGRHR